MKRRPAVVRIVGVLLSLLLIAHSFATLAWISGSSGFTDTNEQQGLQTYIMPMFGQDWAVFAPEPANLTQTELIIRAKLPNGERTGWFNVTATDVEQSILHRPVPSRLYLTNFKLVAKYEIARNALPSRVRSTPLNSFTGAHWLLNLESAVSKNVPQAKDAAIDSYLMNERTITALTASIARVRWGARLNAVQFKIVKEEVPPYSDRNKPTGLREQEFVSGWREPIRVVGMDGAAIELRYGVNGES